MEQNKQHKPMMTEEQRNTLMQTRRRHEQRMQNDPEYRAMWEKRERDIQRFIFPMDSIEDNQ